MLIQPLLPPGSMRALDQPRLRVDDDLVLRPWRPDDAPAVRTAFDQPDIQHWHVRRIDSDDEARQWVAGWAERWAAETEASWAITGPDEDKVLGQIGLRTVFLFEGQAQLSYWTLPAARGARVASRAARALARWTHDTLGLVRLYLVHSTRNEPSCRVATGAGFVLEGTMRRYMRHTDGWHDVHLHARLNDDPESPA